MAADFAGKPLDIRSRLCYAARRAAWLAVCTMPAAARDEAELRAAGGLIWTSDQGADRRIAIVHRRKRADWALPKGKPEAGETPDQTALREAMEETGVNLRLGVFAGRYSYKLKGQLKVVDMWHMFRLPGSYPHRASEDEIDEVVWLTPLEAVQRLTHQVERDFVAAHIGEPD